MNADPHSVTLTSTTPSLKRRIISNLVDAVVSCLGAGAAVFGRIRPLGWLLLVGSLLVEHAVAGSARGRSRNQVRNLVENKGRWYFFYIISTQ